MTQVSGSGITLNVPDLWTDITDALDARAPLTLARSGVDSGVLQFSPALYRKGTIPNPSAADLLSMVQEFGSQQGFDSASDQLVETKALRVAAATFHDGPERHIRVWYVSDGANVLLVTYVGSPRTLVEDLVDCERIVRSVSFTEAQVLQ